VAPRDPLANPAPLIRRVYSYVAYRVGDGADAEDITSETFERAMRYRASFDDSRGTPVAWLLGIARRCVDDSMKRRVASLAVGDFAGPADEIELEAVVIDRVTVGAAINRLDDRSRDLLALRYGADLRAREIAAVLGIKTNTVEVALHRALARLRQLLENDWREQPEAETADAIRGSFRS
jgi:RNA polymerase sigma-70 factor (ECF subfamily)